MHRARGKGGRRGGREGNRMERVPTSNFHPTSTWPELKGKEGSWQKKSFGLIAICKIIEQIKLFCIAVM